MLSEKIDLLMNALNAGSVDIAGLTDYSPTSISRIRSGSRVPKKESPTIAKFVEGLVLFAAETDQLPKLGKIVRCDSIDELALANAVREWLYDSSSANKVAEQEKRRDIFGKRLDMLMALAAMNNRQLSDASGTDYSYLSRLHNGQRLPKSGSDSLVRICQALFRKINADQRLSELIDLTSISPESIDDSTLRDWVCGFTDNITAAAVRSFIMSIEQMPAEMSYIPNIPMIVPESSESHYFGSSGVQSAVIRLLSSIKQGKRLMLYSDNSSEWLTEHFQTQWTALMSRCVKMGVPISVIHSISRNIPEILETVKSWLPIYMTGFISPFYSQKDQGDRFSHTMFICPGNAAIVGFAPAGSEGVYSYVTGEEHLRIIEDQFSVMLDDSRPLLTISSELRYPEEKVVSGRFGSTEVFAGHNSLIINKLSDPCVSFRFEHPGIVMAFRAFLE